MTKLASNSPVTFVIHKRFAISVTAVSPLTIRDLSEISGGRGGGGWKQREGHNFLRLQKREGS